MNRKLFFGVLKAVVLILTVNGMVGGCFSFGATAETGTVMKVPMSTSSEVAKSHFVKGLGELDLDKPSKALAHFQSASKVDPDFALARLGIAYASSSPEATASNLKAASMKAGNASDAEQAWINAALKGFNNDLEGQLVDLNRLTKLVPSSPRAWLQLARCQKAMGRHEDSRKAGTKALEVSPEFVPAIMKMGESYLFDEPRDFAVAEKYMEKILELQPNEYRSHDLLGDVYRAQGNMTMARVKYTRAVELSPEDGMALHQRGHVYSFLGNFDAARADYQAAMDLSDPADVVEFGIGKALVAVWEGNPGRAISELEELVAALETMDIAEPRSSKIWVLSTIVAIAAHYRLEESGDKAIQMSESLLMQQADQVGSEEFRRGNKAQLAYFEGLLAARMGNYEAATTRAQEFMDLLKADTNPRKNEPAHEILGMVNLLQGNYQEAIKQYQVITEDYVYARYHLALAHEGAGNSEVARAMFKEAANYNFNDAGFCLIRNDALAKAAKGSNGKQTGEYEFTLTKLNPSTPVKDQANTGTCWCFATISFIEAEIMRQGGGETDLSEMFVVRHLYPKKAEHYMRYHGKTVFWAGSLAHDAIGIFDQYGIVPEEIYPGTRANGPPHDHGEMGAVLRAILDAVLKKRGGEMSQVWHESIDSVLDIYLGKVPETFEHNGKAITPKKFAEGLGIRAQDYVQLTSFAHHPFFTKFVLDVPDNWSRGEYYNLPLDDFMRVIDHTIHNGFTAVWDGDNSEKGYDRAGGVAVLQQTEKEVTQVLRQKLYDTHASTDDHLMHIVGTAKDKTGERYYIVKDSFGVQGKQHKGFIYMSGAYVRGKTISIMIHKDAIPADLRKGISEAVR
jgi:bleomycin hydrolase